MMRRALAPDAAIIRFAPGRFPPVWGFPILATPSMHGNNAEMAGSIHRVTTWPGDPLTLARWINCLAGTPAGAPKGGSGLFK